MTRESGHPAKDVALVGLLVALGQLEGANAAEAEQCVVVKKEGSSFAVFMLFLFVLYTGAIIVATWMVAARCFRGPTPSPASQLVALLSKGVQSQCTYRRDLATPRFQVLPEHLTSRDG